MVYISCHHYVVKESRSSNTLLLWFSLTTINNNITQYIDGRGGCFHFGHPHRRRFSAAGQLGFWVGGARKFRSCGVRRISRGIVLIFRQKTTVSTAFLWSCSSLNLQVVVIKNQTKCCHMVPFKLPSLGWCIRSLEQKLNKTSCKHVTCSLLIENHVVLSTNSRSTCPWSDKFNSSNGPI